jgi:hypothetical protein
VSEWLKLTLVSHYVIVSTKLGATTPELNADTDYVVMGISH